MRQLYSSQFKKDIVRSVANGKDILKLEKIVENISANQNLPNQYQDKLFFSANYPSRRKCHIEADWFLIYKKQDNMVIFERVGSQSDLTKS